MACSIEHMPQSYPNQAAEGWDNYTQLLNEWLLLGCELISCTSGLLYKQVEQSFEAWGGNGGWREGGRDGGREWEDLDKEVQIGTVEAIRNQGIWAKQTKGLFISGLLSTFNILV